MLQTYYASCIVYEETLSSSCIGCLFSECHLLFSLLITHHRLSLESTADAVAFLAVFCTAIKGDLPLLGWTKLPKMGAWVLRPALTP